MNQHDKPTLGPCPFCGRHVEHVSRADNHSATGKTYIVSCFCGGYSACAHQQEDTLEEVVAAWNRRATLSATQPAQDAQSEPTLRDYAEDLVDAGHDFWKACEREAGGGAVRWLSCDDGTLIVFTRIEYRDEIMAHVRGYKAPVVVFDEDGMTALEAEAAQGAGEVVYQIKGDVFQCPHAWRDADEETFHMVPAKDRRIVYTTPSQPAPVVPEGADGLIRIIGDALLNAHDHLEMHSLEISHCKSAAIIREGLAALASYIKHRNFATTPTPPAQAAADARDALLTESARWEKSDHRLAVWEALRVLGSRMGVMVTREDQYAALATHQRGGK